MARLQLSVKGVDWAASLVRAQQHEQPGGRWSAHQHLFHLLAVEIEVYRPRIAAMLETDCPVLPLWDGAGLMTTRYENSRDLMDLAEEFMRERQRTVEVLKGLTADQWQRTAVWPDGEADLAWVAEKVLAHGLEHFVALLDIHQDVNRFHARQWLEAREDAIPLT